MQVPSWRWRTLNLFRSTLQLPVCCVLKAKGNRNPQIRSHKKSVVPVWQTSKANGSWRCYISSKLRYPKPTSPWIPSSASSVATFSHGFTDLAPVITILTPHSFLSITPLSISSNFNPIIKLNSTLRVLHRSVQFFRCRVFCAESFV